MNPLALSTTPAAAKDAKPAAVTSRAPPKLFGSARAPAGFDRIIPVGSPVTLLSPSGTQVPSTGPASP
jgi:hypothetical protein